MPGAVWTGAAPTGAAVTEDFVGRTFTRMISISKYV